MVNNNLKAELILLCDYALVSQDGKLSILGVFDELRTQEDVAVLSRGFLVATISGNPSKTYTLSVKAETGQKKNNILPPLEITTQTGLNGKANILLEIQGVSFPQQGKYTFKIYNGNIEVGSKEMQVIKVKKNELKEKLVN